MKPEQLSKAHNPLLPAAVVAIKRAAQRARRDAELTRTAIVIAQAGKVVRIEVKQVREEVADYEATDKQQDHEGDA